VLAALLFGARLYQTDIEVIQRSRLLSQLAFKGFLLVTDRLQVFIGQLHPGAQGGFVRSVLGGGQHGQVQAQAVEAVGRVLAERGLEVGALQQSWLDQLAQALFPARLFAAQEFQQGVLTGVEQPFGGELFLLAFGHHAGGLLVLLGKLLALAQQVALLLGQGLDVLAGGVTRLVRFFQAAVEDIPAAALFFAIAELVDALFVILALQFAGVFLLAVRGLAFLAAVGKGFVQLAEGIVFLLAARGQFVADLALLFMQAIQSFLLTLLDDLLAFEVGVLHVGVLFGEQTQAFLEVVQVQLPTVELFQIGLGLVDVGIQVLLVLLLDMVELFFVA